MTPEEIIALQLQYYNDKDLDNFSSLFASSISAYQFPDLNTPLFSGIIELRTRYHDRFVSSPNLRSTVQTRIALGDIVVDEEHITGYNGDNDIRMVVIYEVEEDLITRVWFISGAKDKHIEGPADLQLQGYNARDIDKFLSVYHDDCIIYDLQTGEVRMQGKAVMWDKYAALFESSRDLHARILKRIQLGHYVIDFEEVTGFRGSNTINALAYYQIDNNIITKVWFS